MCVDKAQLLIVWVIALPRGTAQGSAAAIRVGDNHEVDHHPLSEILSTPSPANPTHS